VPVANPLGVGGSAGEALFTFSMVLYLIIVFAAVPCALSLVFRYRRARGVERQQLKRVAFAAVLFVGTNVSQFFYEPPYTWDAFVESVTIVGLYVAIGIAILKYRLYDIDRIINLTLVYGLLTAILAGVYFGGVTATQALFRTLTGQEQLSQLVVVASTLVIAALYNPLRRRIQSFIDRRFYRRKYDAAKTLEGFSLKLRDETDLDALRDDVVGV
jgi:hypothetical protein